MKRNNLKTIDVQAYEWFDKVNGNSYFAGIVTVNFGMNDEQQIIMPFQYGYGSAYEHEAKAVLTANNFISPNYGQSLYTFCKENDIILRTSKKEKCKKSQLKSI